MNWFFDIPNLIVCLISIIIVCRIGIIPNWIGLIFSIYCFVPFFLNDFLFPARYMDDQNYYFWMMKEIRSLNIFPDVDERHVKALSTSWMLSFLPLPYVETVKSIGFFNRFLFFITFCWLYNKKFLTGMPLLLLLFYPSLILYTSLSLRDPLILCIMLVSVILMIDRKYIKFFIIIIPLYFLKFQNFYFILILFIFFIIFNNKYSLKKYGLLCSIISIILLFSFINEITFYLDLYRGAMYKTDGRDMALYEPLNNLSGLLINSIFVSPYFFMKLFPWEVENIFQLIQFIENIFILVFYLFLQKNLSIKVN